MGAPDLDRHCQFGGDHAYQLVLGQQILMGKRPYVDLFWHYGPLAALTSAAGLAVHPSLLPETLICSAGYATALVLVFLLARRRAGVAIALLLVTTNALLLARFYKWYYWLFPLLTLWLLTRIVRSRPRARHLAWLGISAGIAALYRMDLGLGCLGLALGGTMLLQWGRETPRIIVRDLACVVAGATVPLLLWLAVLGSYGGIAAIGDYFQSYWDGARGVTRSMGLPYPRLQAAMLRHPFSLETATAAVFTLLPGMTLITLLVNALPLMWRPVPLKQRYLACIALGALGFFPQAAHRADLPHLMQVLPLFTLAIGLQLASYWRQTSRSTSLRCYWIGHGGLGAAAAVAVALMMAMRPLWCVDLYNSELTFRARMAGLAHVERTGMNSDAARVVQFLRTQTEPGDRIVLLGIECQIPFLAQRQCAGCFVCYAPGLLTGPTWQQRNLALIRKHPPELIVVPQGILDGKAENAIPQYLPDVWQYVESQYPEIAFSTASFVVRGNARFQARAVGHRRQQ